MGQLTPLLNPIRELDVKYSEQSISKSYLGLQHTLRIDELLKYKRPTKYTGAFHFALNVQILSDGSEDFIPFVFLLNGEDAKYDIAKKWVRESIEKRAVKYNYTDFFRDVRDILIRENVLGEEEDFSEIYFRIKFSPQDSRYLLYDFRLNESSHIKTGGKSVSNSISEEINELIRQKEGTDFIQQLSSLYCSSANGICAKELHFSVYGLDGDFQTEEKLTHFFIAAEDKGEITDFFFNYVRKVRDLASYIRTRFTYDLIKKNQWEAIKSAISAIMSRNMSHNLGSHYLYYTKSHLDNVASQFMSYGEDTSQFAPDIRGAAKVLGYVQGRMDYLATVISQDKYPYGSVNFKTHIWDELTVDDFSTRHFSDEAEVYKRTTNYLLSNLVLSENFTRPDVRDGSFSLDNYLLYLTVKYADQKDSSGLDIYTRFTGMLKNKAVEESVKKDLSQLYLALPGGTMSCHAFFNILENFIRNSAKYLQSDFKSVVNKEGRSQTQLIFTIAIRRNPLDSNLLDFIIYDNKQNANRIVDDVHQRTLYDSIVKHTLGELKIIDKTGHIEKEAKGFKEMLFSALWMHAYNFEDKAFADIIADINDLDVTSADSEEEKEKLRLKKLDLIQKYAFEVVQVIDKVDKTDKKNRLNVLRREDILNYTEKDLDNASLGLVLTIPEFKQEGHFTPSDNIEHNKQNVLKIYADIVTVPEAYQFASPGNDFSGLFPRAYSGTPELSIVDKFKSILRRRFEGFDDYCLDFDEGPLGPKETPINRRIRFKRHMNSKDAGHLMELYGDYAYADSISGGNFTITIEQLCKEGWNGGVFDEQTAFFALKVIESALTRITIIDERLYNSNAVDHGDGLSLKEDELSLKNVRILNYNTFEDKLSDILGYCHTLLYNGVKFDNYRKKDEILERLKRTIKYAIEEAVCSVRHLNRITPDMTDVSSSIVNLCINIEHKISNSIASIRRNISEYSELSDEEKEVRSFNENIVKYVNSLHVSELENSAALRNLIAKPIEEIRDSIVHEVNFYADGDISCILQGNVFRDNKDDSLFLSIHLGLVEKMLKNSEWLNTEISHRLSSRETKDQKSKKDLVVYDRLADERVKVFMEMLAEKFASTNAQGGRKELFISIHSGRGNFSRELEHSLKKYPFITLSALENAFNNCKYLLSQLFYNTVYLGKGLANENH